MKTLMLTALLGATLLTAAHAEEVTITPGLTAGSLHDGALDMVATAAPGPDASLELTATFRDPASDDAPTRIVMALQDGDALSFGVPGHDGSIYRVARSGQGIRLAVETMHVSIATASAP